MEVGELQGLSKPVTRLPADFQKVVGLVWKSGVLGSCWDLRCW